MGNYQQLGTSGGSSARKDVKEEHREISSRHLMSVQQARALGIPQGQGRSKGSAVRRRVQPSGVLSFCLSGRRPGPALEKGQWLPGSLPTSQHHSGFSMVFSS